MTMYLGDYNEDDTVYFLWATNDSDGASITRAVDGTVSVYKDNGTSQSVAGVTDTEDFDSLTGIHACTIDLSADAFYATGADYAVVLSGATIDGQTVNAVLAHFSIENRYPVGKLATKAEIRPELMVSTTIATLASQTSFTLTDGSSDDDAYNGCQVMVTDSATEQQKCVGLVSAYTGATKTVTLTSDPGIFTMAVGDTVEILAAPKQLPDAEHGANGGLVTGDANNRIAGIQGTKNTLDDLNDSEASVLLTSTTIATLASQTSFTLTAGSGDDDAYNGAFAIITDQTTPTQKCFAVVESYVGSTKTVTLASDPGIFTMAAGDYIDIIAASGWTPGEKEQIRDALGVDGSKNTATGGQLQTVDTNVDSILADTGTDGVVVAAASKTGYALTSAEHTNIADALLKRDWTSVVGEASRSVLNALRFLRNKWSVSGGTLTVTEEDDATTAWTATVTDDAGADPITGVDPT